jgi:hypothetical protein
MAKRKTEIDYHTLAKCRGFRWVGPFPKSTQVPTWWECEKGDRWLARYHDIQQGSGCPICYGNVKKTKEDYHKLAKDRGFKWSSDTLPKDTGCLTWWECEKCGYRWKAQYHSIQQGRGCPVCSGLVKKTEKDYYELAKSRGFKWVDGVFPKNVRIPTWWECEKCDYRWKTHYNSIQQGRGCPGCANLAIKTEKDYHKLAESRGFKWLGSLPKNTKDPTWWECEKGDKWLAKYHDIQQGSGCPYCINIINGQRVSKPQIKLNNLLCGDLNYPESRHRIDVAIMRNSQKIAVEYDCQYWHGGREKQDAERDKFLISCGWKVLHVKSNSLLPNRKQLKQAINQLLKDRNIVNLYLEDWV